nr:MAG TPA: hypothetical protein [Caudoviricetes sp.]
MYTPNFLQIIYSPVKFSPFHPYHHSKAQLRSPLMNKNCF